MLSRRGFVGCALCALGGFAATDADAQVTQAASFKRTILGRVDGPAPGYETIDAKTEIAAGTPIGRHTHFGFETTYVVEGSLDLNIDGQGSKTYNKGDSFQVPTGVVHGGETGSQPLVLSTVYVVEKGKPLATPA